MPNKIERYHGLTDSIVATNSASTSPKIPFGAAGGGMMFVDAASSATSVTWYACATPLDSAVPVYSDGAGITTTIAAGNAYALPDGLFGAPLLVAVTNAGTATFRLSVKG